MYSRVAHFCSFFLLFLSGYCFRSVCVVLMLQIMYCYCSKWTIDRKRETQRAVVVAVFDNNHEILRSTLLFFFFDVTLLFISRENFEMFGSNKIFCRYNRVLLNFTTIILDNIGNTSTTIERRFIIFPNANLHQSSILCVSCK